jgi:hypothetical protein
VAFQKGMESWDQKFANMIEKRDKDIDEKIPAKKK